MLRGFVPPFTKGLARHPAPWSTRLVVPAVPSAPSTPSPADAGTAYYTLLSWLAAGATTADVYLSTSASAVSYVAAVLSDSPAAYWRLDEISGTFIDQIAGLVGTPTETITRQQASALSDGTVAITFDGAAAGIDVPNTAVLNPGLGSYTIELWMKRNGNPGASEFLFNKGVTTAVGGEIFMDSGGHFNSRINGLVTVVSAGLFGNNAWHHVVMVENRAIANGGQCYVDGVASGAAVDLTSQNAVNMTGTASLLLGRRAAGNFFGGSLDEVAWYTHALTAAQVANHYAQRLAGPPVGLHVVGASYVPTLLPATTYAWQVVAINAGGATPGPIWSFTTPSATRVIVTIAGVVSTHVQADSLSIRDVLNAQPNTASLTLDAAPTVGQAVQIGLSSLDAADLIFGGEIQHVGESYVGTSGFSLWPIDLIDNTFALNKRRPFGTWTSISATTIAQTIIGQYAPGFTALHVQAGLPLVSINFDGSADFLTCLGYLATAIGGFSDVDYTKDVHLFLTEAADAPDPLDASHPPLADPSPITFSTDLSQVRTKASGKGHGETVPCDVAAGETIVPIVDASMFTASGGQAIAGTISGGAQSQKLTYAGVHLGGGGSLVGPGATPSTAPTLILAAGAGLGSGVYQYAYTYVTPSGESLPSPLGTVITPGLVPGATTFNHFEPGLGVGQLAVGTTYEYACAWSKHVTVGNHSQETPVGALVAVVAQAYGGGGSDFNVVNLPFTTDATVLYVYVYRRISAGAYHYLGARANNDPLTTWSDGVSDASVSGNPAPSNTLPAGNQVTVTGIAIGASPTTSRKVYRTVVNGAQLKLHSTIANDTDSALPANDSTADGSLGANAPTSDLSGLAQPSGQVNAGSAALPTASPAPFPAAGWVLIGGGQTIRYTGISGNSLTGIPTSGPGSITTTVIYGSQALPAPALTGVNANNGLVLAMAKGSSVKIWVERNDLAAQAALGQLELDANGNPTDGIHEFQIIDERRGEASLSALCDADLAIFSRPIVSATYSTRDPKSKSGKTVHVDLAGWGLVGDFVIQDVTLTFDGPALAPRYQVHAASVAFTLADLLRKVVLTS